MEDILRILDPSCSATPSPLQLMEVHASWISSNSFEKTSHLLFVYFIGHEKKTLLPLRELKHRALIA